jgi:hypothetical protein
MKRLPKAMLTAFQNVSHFDTDAVIKSLARMTESGGIHLRIPFVLSCLSFREASGPSFRSAERRRMFENSLTLLMPSDYKLRHAQVVFHVA